MAGTKVTEDMIPIGFRFYRDQIARIAREYGLDPALVAAMCWKESAFTSDAFRFEPDFWNRYLKGNPLYRHLNPRRVSSSYGLMQVMYCRLLEDKIKENDTAEPETLFLPEVNLRMGCAFFVELQTWAKARVIPATVSTSPDFIALAAYNGGRGGNDPAKNWPLKCGRYAADVLERAAVLRRVWVP